MCWLNLIWLLALVAKAGDQPRSEPGGSKHPSAEQVDALVEKLASTRPPPHPDNYWLTGEEEDLVNLYATPAVSNSIAQLKASGPTIFPYLVQHLNDRRYSCSQMIAQVENYTVGVVILDILSDYAPYAAVYKTRETPNGRCLLLTFEDWIEGRGKLKWADWAEDRSRLEIQLGFIDWCVAKEA